MKTHPERARFKARVSAWARKLGVKVRAVYVRPMRRKWASCSSAGTPTFNAELITLERELADYVIVHELLHISVPNHGRLWQSLMRVHLGEHGRLKGRLDKLGLRGSP